MIAPHAAIFVVGVLLLIAVMYVWMIRSNRRHHRMIERRRHGWNTEPHGWNTEPAESVMANHDRSRR